MKRILNLFLIAILAIAFIGCKKETNNGKKDEVHTHSYSELIAQVDPTCVKEGTKAHYECTSCHKYFNESYEEITDLSIAKVSHVLTDFELGYNATCSSKGQESYWKCEKCHNYINSQGKILEDVTIDYVDHQLSELHEKVEATCFSEGYKAYYSCKHCEVLFDENFKELSSIVIKPVGKHTWNNATCTKCGYVEGEAISVCEAIATMKHADQFKVRGVVAGCTGTCDGGYSVVILKDEVANQYIYVRRGEATEDMPDAKNEFCGGTSFSPSMCFELGDIVELEVYMYKYSSSSKGGNKSNTCLIYAGLTQTDCGSLDDYIETLVVDHDDNFEAGIDNYTTVINSDSQLQNFVTTGGKQMQLVVFEGTHDNPIKFVTNTEATADQLSREYIYPYWNNASSIEDLTTTSGTSIVFSNFGNKFNLRNDLSYLLFSQKEYKAADFSEPYTYEGRLYAILVGGNDQYAHFIVLNQDSIKNDNQVEEARVSASVAKKTYFKAMEKKAAEIGINLASNITSPVGVSNTICTNDLCRIVVAMTEHEKSMELWSNAEFIGTWTDVNGEQQSRDFPNSTGSNASIVDCIEAKYGVGSFVGAKGGSLKYTSERGHTIATLGMCIQYEGYYLCGALNLNSPGDVHDERSTKFNKIVLMSYLYDILLTKYRGGNTTALEAKLDVACAAGVMFPIDDRMAYDFDWFAPNSGVISYSKNGTRLITTASVWKMMTCITAMDYFDETDLTTQILVEKSELSSVSNSAWPKCVGGEYVTLDVALHSMMRRSSNVAPSVIARYLGEKIYNQTH